MRTIIGMGMRLEKDKGFIKHLLLVGNNKQKIAFFYV